MTYSGRPIGDSESYLAQRPGFQSVENGESKTHGFITEPLGLVRGRKCGQLTWDCPNERMVGNKSCLVGVAVAFFIQDSLLFEGT